LGAIAKRLRFVLATTLLLAPFPGYSQEKGSDAAPAKKKLPPVLAEAADAKPDVVLSGKMSRESAGPGEDIRFWITVENRSDKPLEKVWLEHLDVPGFTLVRRCWSDSRADAACFAKNETPAAPPAACETSSQQLLGTELCELLGSKQTLTVWGDVHSARAAPPSADFAVVRWTSGASTSRAVVTLGQVESYGRLRSVWEAVTGNWQIGIPVWIAVFSGLYALWKSWREGKAHQKATEFEQQRHTWNLLLLKVHGLAFQHYMPIVSTIQGVLLYFQRLKLREGNPEENRVGAFCYVVRFHWRVRKMKRSGASWYFKDLTAEELVVTLVQTHRHSLGLSDLRRQAALDEFLEDITEEMTVAGMLKYLENVSETQARFWDDFCRWMVRVEARQEGALLSALTKVITYETNRPYLYWYEELRAIDWTDEELRKIREVAKASDKGQKGFSARVESYLKDTSTDKNIKITQQRGKIRKFFTALRRDPSVLP